MNWHTCRRCGGTGREPTASATTTTICEWCGGHGMEWRPVAPKIQINACGTLERIDGS